MRQFVRAALVGAILAVIGGALGCGGGSSSPTNPIATPVIASITPQSGSVNTSVTIRGSNFGTLQGNSTVTYDGVTTSVTSWSNTVIVATVPAGALTGGTFVVNVNGFLSNPSPPFSVAGAAFAGLSPNSGIPGSQVTITGSGFGATQGSSSSSYVVFNGQTAPITYWSDTNIICTVPTGLQSGGVTVVVVVGGKQSNYQTFNVILPQITSILYSDGSTDGDNPGSTVTVTGQGFGTSNATPNTYVTVDGKTVTTLTWGDTSILVTLPKSGLTADVHTLVVVVNGQNSNTGSVRVNAPSILSQSPTTFSENQTATLNGKFFGNTQSEGNGTIQVEDYGNVAYTSWNDTSISFKWPISNVAWTQTKTVTVTVGGLSGSFIATAE